jgi:L-fuculose-phosphate aldolase
MKEGKIRFNTTFASNEVPSDNRIKELKEWCESFQKNDLTPEIEGNYTGNLSFRTESGFIITASGLKNKENLFDDCFVHVKNYDKLSNTVYVEGKSQPSSEAVMHFLIYQNRPEVNSIFHGHSDIIIEKAEKLKLPVTKIEHQPGSKELAEEVLRALKDNNLIIIKNHGFISLGKTMKEAGEQALETSKRSKNINP